MIMIECRREIPEAGPELESELQLASLFMQKDILAAYDAAQREKGIVGSITSHDSMMKFGDDFRSAWKQEKADNAALLLYRYTNEREQLVREFLEKLNLAEAESAHLEQKDIAA